MTLITSRRSLLIGFGALVAAPAIVRASNIMPVKQMLILPDNVGIITFPIEGFAQYTGMLTSYPTLRNDVKDWYEPTPEKISDFSSRRWKPNDNIMADASERWERLRKRELTIRPNSINCAWGGNYVRT